MKSFDYFIIGQGIAGTNLSSILISHGKRVLVIDRSLPHTSSKVAAGLLNPVTGRKMSLTWMAGDLFPFLKSFYTEAEKKLYSFPAEEKGVYESFTPPVSGNSFYHPMPVYRPFKDAEQQNDRMGIASEGDEFSELISPSERPFPNLIHDTLGGLMLNGGGFVDLPTLLCKHRVFLRSHDALLEEEVHESDFKFSEQRVFWKGFEAKGVIFCRGLNDADSQMFKFLKFRPVKGEILDLQIENSKITYIVNRGVWVIPVGDGLYRCGSTYNHKNLDSTVTEKAQEHILERFSKLFNVSEAKVIAHRAGVRPATYDTKPFIGRHPEIQRAYVFGGFGSKGVSLTPYFASAFAEFLENGKPLPKEVSLERVM